LLAAAPAPTAQPPDPPVAAVGPESGIADATAD
jgi:hypothetical protein